MHGIIHLAFIADWKYNYQTVIDGEQVYMEIIDSLTMVRYAIVLSGRHILRSKILFSCCP